MINIFHNKKFCRTFLPVIVIFVLLFTSVSYSWLFKDSTKQADTDAIEVEEPPILYILDSDAQDITQLSLSGMEIGVTKQIVFCVSSVYPIDDSVNGHKRAFNLELAYTNNLGANFELYNAEIVTAGTAGAVEYDSQIGTAGYFVKGTLLTDENISTEGNDIAYSDYPLYDATDGTGVQKLNIATYKKYLSSSTDGDANSSLHFTDNNGATDPLFNTSKCRFFILNISWDLDNLNKKDIEKETDLIYILARGGADA